MKVNITRLLLLSMMTLMYNRVNAQSVLSLYKDGIPGSKKELNKEEEPTLTVFLPTKEKANGSAIIIFPGGGYSFLATSTEGDPIAKAFAEKGITAFVVKYRLPDDNAMIDKSIGPLMDAQQAMKVVRSKASHWNIDTQKVGIAGFSAGGHLASTLGTHFKTSYISNPDSINLRPDFIVLVYPVISMDNSLTHRSSRINLLGDGPAMDKELFFSNEEQVTKETPPTYLTHCGDDQLVDVNNSITFYQALQRNGVDAELHLFPKGDHGFIQRIPVKQWLDPILNFLAREGLYKPL